MNHKKVVIVAVALVALLAIAGIGAAYAYTASTQSKNNTSDPGYMTLKLSDGSAPKYSDSFNKMVTFDTSTDYVNNAEVTTYTLDETQFDTMIYSDVNNAVKIGEVYINVAYEKVTDEFVIYMEPVSGMSNEYTYYAGYSSGANKAAADTAAVTYGLFSPTAGFTMGKFTGGDSSGVKVIKVGLFLTKLTAENKTTAPDKPLNNVTFKFTSAVVNNSTAKISASVVADPVAGGTITSDVAEVYAKQTQVFTCTATTGYDYNGVAFTGTPLFDTIGNKVIVFVDTSGITGTASFVAEPSP